MPFRLNRHELTLFAILVLCSVAAGALLWCRFVYTGTTSFGFLAWNLFLAWVPLGAAGMLHLLERYEHLTKPRAAALLALWLLFFPNAPYIVTDFHHLRPRPEAPLWFDIVLLTSFAWLGVMIGFVSLFWVQDFVRRRAGEAIGIAASIGVLVLSGFGIYLGRFVRMNSWDVIVRPASALGEVFDRVANPLSHPRTLAVTLLYAAFLILAYLTLLTFLAAGRRLAAAGAARVGSGC